MPEQSMHSAPRETGCNGRLKLSWKEQFIEERNLPEVPNLDADDYSYIDIHLESGKECTLISLIDNPQNPRLITFLP